MSKKTIVWIIIIVVVVLGAWLLSKKLTGKSLGEFIGLSPTPSSSPTPTPKALRKATPTPVVTPSITYEQALIQYADRKIQFNEKCQGIPGQMSLKAGQKLLIDNRSNDQKTLTFDNQTYTLPAYNWRIITVLAAKALPYNLGVTCNSSNGTSMLWNSVVINLQANVGQGL